MKNERMVSDEKRIAFDDRSCLDVICDDMHFDVAGFDIVLGGEIGRLVGSCAVIRDPNVRRI
jgi:hypothetical protein